MLLTVFHAKQWQQPECCFLCFAEGLTNAVAPGKLAARRRGRRDMSHVVTGRRDILRGPRLPKEPCHTKRTTVISIHYGGSKTLRRYQNATAGSLKHLSRRKFTGNLTKSQITTVTVNHYAVGFFLRQGPMGNGGHVLVEKLWFSLRVPNGAFQVPNLGLPLATGKFRSFFLEAFFWCNTREDRQRFHEFSFCTFSSVTRKRGYNKRGIA